MTGTDDLIRRLAERAVPVRRLRPPLMRAALWLAVVVPALLGVALVMGPRVDLAGHLAEPSALLTLGAGLVTAFCAAAAALALGIPGLSPGWALLPLPPMLVWLAGFGRQCVLEWLGLVEGSRLGLPHPECLPDIVVMTAVPTVVMVMMVRRGAWLRPRLALAMGGLAVAALTNSALGLIHPDDAGLLVLLVQFAVLASLAAVLGRTPPIRSIP
ncbi:NrsF family protein [Magnetospirillum sp. SS-4]|uniref:NrsF family protein n=1 Tax=Magnetospirillum sp. SS-4 TaxID=2681465 RepID=UPI0013819A19|nr:NrsF family protein [Magnetospirillum sp. SS-4]CAA7624745.1 Amino acid transporter [Magnetospirillum sp. SS-4]